MSNTQAERVEKLMPTLPERGIDDVLEYRDAVRPVIAKLVAENDALKAVKPADIIGEDFCTEDMEAAFHAGATWRHRQGRVSELDMREAATKFGNRMIKSIKKDAAARNTTRQQGGQ